jgi:TPP-dependent 2-oxoacid decarboxylase
MVRRAKKKEVVLSGQPQIEIIRANPKVENRQLLEIFKKSGHPQATMQSVYNAKNQLNRQKKQEADKKRTSPQAINQPGENRTQSRPAPSKDLPVPSSPIGKAQPKQKTDVLERVDRWVGDKDLLLKDIRAQRQQLQQELAKLDEAEQLMIGSLAKESDK